MISFAKREIPQFNMDFCLNFMIVRMSVEQVGNDDEADSIRKKRQFRLSVSVSNLTLMNFC